MGNSMSSYYDDMDDIAYEEKRKKRKAEMRDIAKILLSVEVNDTFSDYDDIMYLYKNRRKILRNKKLLDLIG